MGVGRTQAQQGECLVAMETCNVMQVSLTCPVSINSTNNKQSTTGSEHLVLNDPLNARVD